MSRQYSNGTRLDCSHRGLRAALMELHRYSFRPRPVPTLLTFALLPLLLALGVWQLHRAEEKRAVWELQERNAQRSPVMLSPEHRNATDLLGAPVQVRGHWDRRHQVLLVNQTYRGEPGYEVYTPLRIEGSGIGVMVDRGWIRHELGQARLPDPAVDPRPVTLLGVVDTPPSIGLKLGDAPDAGQGGWPRQVQYLDLEWLEAQLGYPLLPFVVLHLEGDPAPLIRSRDPEQVGKGGMPPEKHISYALQWFSLAAALLVIYIVVNIRRAGRGTEDRT